MRLLVIEDDLATARFVCAELRASSYEVECCEDVVEGLRRARDEHWDALVLDRMLGARDGLEVLQALRRAGKRTPVLILSALATLDERVRGLRAGGDDYLAKPFAPSELSARIEALLRRSAALDGARQLAIADLRLDLDSRRVERAGQAILLQPREFRLLEYFVRHRDQVVTRGMLLEAVWDYHFDPQTNVIDVQISRLRTKIDKGHALPLLHTLRGIGYLLSERRPDAAETRT
ncbi:MAG: response regulator transcription factor [Proteobacteria bacterium]|nr:response regulator transcription factor [Pseudomonadota bacterium]